MTDAHRSPTRADVDLIRGIAAGEVDALQRLFDRHSPVLIRQAVRITGDRAGAEDVVQDVFVKVWSNAASFDTARGSVTTWLHMMCHSRSLDMVRGSLARSRRELAHPAAATTIGDLSDGVTVGDRQRELHHAVAQLPGAQRTMIELTYFRGLTYRAAAEHLAIPEGTAKTQVRQALTALRRSILDVA